MAGAAMTRPNQSAMPAATDRDQYPMLRMGSNVLMIVGAVHQPGATPSPVRPAAAGVPSGARRRSRVRY